MARYGNKGRGPERVPDWVWGGTRRRAVLERLRDEEGWTAIRLAEEIGGGEAWVFEVYRVLRSVEALETVEGGGYRLASGRPLGDAFLGMLEALEPYRDVPVDRPPSRMGKD